MLMTVLPFLAPPFRTMHLCRHGCLGLDDALPRCLCLFTACAYNALVRGGVFFLLVIFSAFTVVLATGEGTTKQQYNSTETRSLSPAVMHVMPELEVLGSYPAGAIRRNAVSSALGCLWGSLKRSARAVQLFGRLAVLETHTL